MFDYTPLKAVLRFIPKGIRKESSDSTLLGYALDAYRDLNVSQRYTNDIQLLPINNHKVDLPDCLVLINHVTYTNKKHTKKEEKSILECYNNVSVTNTTEESNCGYCGIKIECGCPGVYFTDDVNAYCTSCGCHECIAEAENFSTRTNRICRPTLNYQLFLDSDYYRKCYSPLKYVGQANCILSKDCPNRQYRNCNETFSFSAANKQIITSVECGMLCLNYSKETRDENGDFLIPKESSLLRGLSYYAIAMAWQDRSGMKEQNANSMFMQYLQLAENMLRKARGVLIQSSIDDNLIREISGYDERNARMSRLPLHLIQKRKYYRR